MRFAEGAALVLKYVPMNCNEKASRRRKDGRTEGQKEERKGKKTERKRKEKKRKGKKKKEKERKEKERKRKEKERKGKKRKGKERKGKERKRKKRKEKEQGRKLREGQQHAPVDHTQRPWHNHPPSPRRPATYPVHGRPARPTAQIRAASWPASDREREREREKELLFGALFFCAQ